MRWEPRRFFLLESLRCNFVSASFPSTYSFRFLMTFAGLWFKMMPKREFQERSMVLKVLPNSISGSKKKFKNGEVW